MAGSAVLLSWDIGEAGTHLKFLLSKIRAEGNKKDKFLKLEDRNRSDSVIYLFIYF